MNRSTSAERDTPTSSGELGNGPWVARTAVKQREALAHDRVPRAREPSGRLIGKACDISSQRIHEQRFRQLGEHRVATGAIRGGLLDEMQDRLLQPVAGAIGPDVHLQHAAASSRESARRAAGHRSSSHTRTASSLHRHRRASATDPGSRSSRVLPRSRPGSASAAAQMVRIPVRKHHDVAWRQLDIGPAFQTCPRRTLHDEVIDHDVRRAGRQRRRQSRQWGVESRHGAENSALKNIAPFNRTPLNTSENASIVLRTPGKVSWRLRKAF